MERLCLRGNTFKMLEKEYVVYEMKEAVRM